MPTATVNGVDLAYVEQGGGEPVLFVHGGSGDYRVWGQQMDAFGAGYRVIALSCRGSWPHAKLRPDETLTLDTFVDDLAGFIRALDAGPVNLIGHSSPGGFAGLCLALRHPSLPRTLVLLEPPAFPVLGVNIPPRPGQLLKLFCRSPRVAASFVRFGARGIAPAMKAFARGDDEQAIRLFVTANFGADAVAVMPREQFQLRRKPRPAQGPAPRGLSRLHPGRRAGDPGAPPCWSRGPRARRTSPPSSTVYRRSSPTLNASTSPAPATPCSPPTRPSSTPASCAVCTRTALARWADGAAAGRDRPSRAGRRAPAAGGTRTAQSATW